MKKFIGILYLFMAISLIFGSVASICAQETDSGEFMLEEITVTAEKREASLQKTAMAISAVTGSDVVSKGLITMDEVLKDIPNVTMAPIGFGSTVTIRGLGFDLPVGVGEGAVSTNFDGTFNNNTQTGLFGYFDLDRVEVLRGPQGTLYGRNATAGAVNMVSKNPNTENIEGYLAFEAGNYKLHREEGAINLPLTENSATRLAFANINRAGYMSTGTADAVGNAVRGKYLYEPSEDLSLMVSVSSTILGGKSPNGYVTPENYASGNTFLATETSPQQSYDYRAYKLNASLEMTAGPGVITFLPATEKSKERSWSWNQYDEVLAQSPRDITQTSAELRYSSNEDSYIIWQAGLYYYDREQEDAPTENNPSGYTRGAESKAVYGQVTYPVSDVFRVTAGGRWSDEIVTYDDPPDILAMEADFGGFDWKLGLEYDLREDILTYLTLATSRRPGGINDTGDYTGLPYEEEKLLSYEIGAKGRFLDNRLQLNAAVFYYDYEGYQAFDAWLDDENEIHVLFFNVDEVMDYGAELEAEVLIGKATVLSGSVSYLHARYDSTFIVHDSPTDAGLDLNGRVLPRSPDFSLKGSVEHTFTLPNGSAIKPSVSARWLDDQYLAPYQNDVTFAPAYTVVDAYVRYVAPSNNWSLNCWAKNALDEVYKAGGGTNNTAPGAPRMVGATLTIQF